MADNDNKPPMTTFIRRGELVEWLGKHGVSENSVRKMIESGAIKKEFIGGGRRAYYRVRAVSRLLGVD